MSKRKFKSNKRTNISIVVALLLFISVGFALIGSNLNIIGTTNIASTKWDVHWANLSVTSGSVTGTQVTTPAAIKTGNTEVEFSISLNKPGEFYEFTVDAVNQGTLDAMIESITNGIYESDGTTTKTLPSYLNYTVTYDDGIAIAQYHKLAASTTEKIKIRVEFKTDVEASQLPESGDTVVFKYGINYVQADSNALDKPLPYVYTVNKYDFSVTTPQYNAVWLNQAFPESITKYNTPSEALAAIATASSKDLPFYLKHKIENGNVTESYVEFVVTEAMASANSGMVAGTYTLRGGINEYSLTDKPIFIQNAKKIYDAFGTNCSTNPYTTTISSSSFDCHVSGLSASAGANGFVFSYDVSGGSSCSVDNNGYSSCDW